MTWDRTVYAKINPLFFNLGLGRWDDDRYFGGSRFFRFSASETGKYCFRFAGDANLDLYVRDGDDQAHFDGENNLSIELDLSAGETVPFRLDLSQTTPVTVYVDMQRPIHTVTLWFDSSASDHTLTQPTPVLVQSSLCDLYSHLNVISILKCCDVEYTCTISPKDGYYFVGDCAVTVLGLPGSSALNILNYGDSITVNAAMKVHSSTSFSPWDDISTEYAETLGLDHTDLGHWQYCNCNPCNETVYRFVPNTYTLRLCPLLLPDDTIPPIENILYGAVIADLEELTAAVAAVEAMGYTFEGWFWDSRCTVPLTESDMITSDRMLYGKMSGSYTPPAGPEKLKAANVTRTPISFYYNGERQQPAVTVTNSRGEVLTKDVDYTVTYPVSVDPGYYLLRVTGIGNYTGTVRKEYMIKDAGMAIRVTQAPATFVANGEQQQPAVTVTNGAGDILTEGVDYTVSYPTSVEPGSYRLRVDGLGVYAGQLVRKTYVIKEKLTAAGVSRSPISFTANGERQQPTVTVRNAAGDILTEGVDYRVVYPVSVDPGRYLLRVDGIGAYAGHVYKEYKIK